jgi:hypothetical protein
VSRRKDRVPQFSLGTLAVASLGAGTVVLALTVLVIFALKPGAAIGLTVALLGLVASIATMGFVSTRLTNRTLDRIEDAERAARPDAGQTDGG